VGIEPGGEVGVAEPDDGVLADQDSPEQAEVVVAERVEAGIVAPLLGLAPAQASRAATPLPLRGAAARASR
jgi:hypothetical protein